MTTDQRLKGAEKAIYSNIWAERTTGKNRLWSWRTRVEAGRPVRSCSNNPGNKKPRPPNVPSVTGGLKIFVHQPKVTAKVQLYPKLWSKGRKSLQ